MEVPRPPAPRGEADPGVRLITLTTEEEDPWQVPIGRAVPEVLVAEVLRHRGDAAVIAGLGSPAWDYHAAGDSPLNFYFWGAWGARACSDSAWPSPSLGVGCWSSRGMRSC